MPLLDVQLFCLKQIINGSSFFIGQLCPTRLDKCNVLQKKKFERKVVIKAGCFFIMYDGFVSFYLNAVFSTKNV